MTSPRWTIPPYFVNIHQDQEEIGLSCEFCRFQLKTVTWFVKERPRFHEPSEESGELVRTDRGYATILSRIYFFVVTSAMELGAGSALVCCPSLAVRLLVGAPLDAPSDSSVARVAGAALLALGLACWFARRDAQSQAAKGLLAAMLVYDVVVATVLAHVGLAGGMPGVALWPAVTLHSGMVIWGLILLKDKRGQESA